MQKRLARRFDRRPEPGQRLGKFLVGVFGQRGGDASRHFETAKAPLLRVKQRYQDGSKREAAASIDTATTLIDQAQRMAGKLDPAANNKAGQALEALKAAAK